MTDIFPRVLIVSNNPLSTTENNGKTLTSLFKSYDSQKVSQLFFQNVSPTVSISSYFQITDRDAAEMVFLRKRSVGRVIQPKGVSKQESKYNPTSRFKDSYFLRFVRDLLWVNIPYSNELLKWCDSIKPQILFFLAGDSLFAYRIVMKLCSRYDIPLVVYVTDDYISRSSRISPFFWIRRHGIERALREAACKSSLLLTISDKMRSVFKFRFGVDSYVFRNEVFPSYHQLDERILVASEPIVLVFAGGLHYNRWKVLLRLAKAIQESNESNQTKLHLNIYCTQKVDSHIVRALSVPRASSYMGSVNQTELEEIYRECQVLVHVEAFDKRSINAVGLSFSTKITEYLAMSKCILAVGPSEVASMEFLMDCAFCITDIDGVTAKAVGQLVNPNFRAKFASLADKRVKNGESLGITSREFSERLREILL